MTRLNIASIPAVRRARLADVPVLAVLAAALGVVITLAFLLHPLVGLASVGIGVIIVADHFLVVASIMRRRPVAGAEPVLERNAAPALWDAVHACAARAGIPPPRIYVIDPHVKLLAGSWGFGKERSIGVQGWMVARFPPEWLRATVAHEMAHLITGDLLVGTVRMFLRAWLLAAAWCLGLAGIMALLGAGGQAKAGLAFAACVAAVGSYVATELLNAFWMPHVRYLHEYAADAVGIAFTGDPLAAMGLMIFFSVALGQPGRDPRPRPGGTHPPPLVRAQRILQEHKDVFFRRP